MRKLLLGAIVVLGAIISAKAQTTIVSTTFGTTIPVGWTQQLTTVNAGWKFGTSFGANMQSYAPAQGDDAYVDDWDNNTTYTAGWDTLKTTIINCSTYPKVYITGNFMFWQDDGNETGNIIVSKDGGVTWTSAFSLPNTNGGWINGAIIDLSAIAGSQANVMIGFTYYNGYATTTNGYVAVGMAIENPMIYAPAPYDVQVATQNLPYLMQVGQAYTFSGTDNNLGGTQITSMNMNYSVNGGPAQVQSIPSIAGFNGLTTYNWSMPAVQYTPAAPGVYTVKYWASNLNSNPNINTDTLVAKFWAIDSVKPRTAVYEEFTGQSCVFCMLAAPNMDSVADNNATTSSIVRYHVPIPARDFMYVTTAGVVNPRETYYSVSGAPAGDLDGVSLYPGADYGPPSQRYSSTTLQGDNFVGSPMKIDITTAKYDAVTDSFIVSANITSYATFAAGLTAQVVLTIDSITYSYDLSMDDPQQEFAPPIGSGSSCCSYANAPDRYFDFTKKFTHVVEDMLPSGSGTSLGAFTVGQTQTLNLKWKKNHPWGAYDKGAARDSDYYDSSATGQFVVFVQTNSAISADGVPAKYVFQSAHAGFTMVTGMQEITTGVSFGLYPNPASNQTNVSLDLLKDQNISVDVYNLVGEKIYSMNQGSMPAGHHTLVLNSSGFASGVYLVKVTADNASSMSKLVISH